MTEKLYYTDPYMREFNARVLSVTACEGGFDIVLDRSAFFPEEGGQGADTGVIGGAKVTYVYEKEGILHHIADIRPDTDEVSCKIDFDTRFEKMQCHTAEHILCGIIHSRFGYENVGFHLGDDLVTFDVGGVLTAEDIAQVERLANEAVFANLPVRAFFPANEELAEIQYRSKLDITEGVRLVKIGDVDICACCAPHVGSTAEIGVIKILDFMKHRGGTRIFMLAGRRALADYCAKQNTLKKISALLSAPQLECDRVLLAYMKESDGIRAALKQSRLKLAEEYAAAVKPTEDNALFLFPDFSIPELIAFCNIATERVGGLTVALSGADGDYKYVISSPKEDLAPHAGEINSALNGRGGGRGGMIQGSFCTDYRIIADFFAKYGK